MALFEKADPDLKAQRDAEAALKAKRKQGDNKAADLGEAESELAKCLVSVQQAALGDDKAKRKAALEAKREAEDEIAALREAAATIAKEITGIEAQIDQIVDKRCRIETSIAVNAMADRIARAQGAHEAAALELESAANEGGILIPESRAVYEFTLSARQQLQPAIQMVVAGLHAHAKAVIAGGAPASLPRPAAPAPKLAIVPPPPTPTLTLIPTKKLRYTDASGAVIVCGAYRQHTFPQALGELALRTNVAVALNDKRVRDFQAAGLATVGTPEESACQWLGKPGREAPERFGKPGGPAIHSSLTSFTPAGASPFTVLDRGPAIVGTMPAQPIEAMPKAATRNAEDGEP
jgi:hypothetical protein